MYANERKGTAKSVEDGGTRETTERPRVALIGPILPFRGGIAQHTTMLNRALSTIADVTALSFSRQYPRRLFPGESDRDPSFDGYLEPGVEYVVDSLDPRTWHRALTRLDEVKPDLVLIPWWTVFWAPCFTYLAHGFRRRRIPVVFLCHNVAEHEAAAWKRLLTRSVLRLGSSFIVQSREDEVNLRELIPNPRVLFRPHPVYGQFPKAEGTLPRKAATELLFFGFVRPYKGLDTLLDAMALLKDRDVHLTIAGEFWSGREETEARRHSLGLEDAVEIVPRYITDQEAAEYFQRADAVVLPYNSATGSGVVGLAYRYGKPVVVTRVGGLPDVVAEGRTGLVVPPKSPAELAEALVEVGNMHGDGTREAIDALVGSLGWDAFVEAVLDFGSSAVAPPVAAKPVVVLTPVTPVPVKTAPRILFLSRAYPPDIGGIQTQNHDLAEALGKLTDIRIISNGRGRSALPWFLPYAAIRALTLAHNYDAVLLGDGLLAVVGWVLKRLQPRTCVVSAVHGLDLTFTSRVYQSMWVHRFLPSLDRFIAVSEETRKVAVELGLPPERVVVVPNGVVAGELPPRDRVAVSKLLGRSVEGRLLVLSLGRLVKRKGFAWFAEEVVPQLPPEALYVVAGDGPERDRIAEAAARAGVANRVLLLGRVDDDARETLLGGCDVFVQPNVSAPGDMEGFGIVVLEAGAAGLPVVAARLEGLKDAVRDGVNGMLVDSEDADGFAHEIERLLADEPARVELGRSAAAYVRETYSWSHIGHTYLDLIQESTEDVRGALPESA